MRLTTRLQTTRSTFNPIRTLTPESLSRTLDDFHAGNLRNAALIWDAIERRDDLLQGVISRRKKAVSRLNWEITTVDDSAQAREEKAVLEFFYRNLSCQNAYDENERGGMSLLLKQMMDAVGKRYAIHEVILKPVNIDNRRLLTADFRFVPLWFFENKSGRLRFMPDYRRTSMPLEDGEWLVTTGDGLMESSSIAYLFKHLPLRDWLIYCERNGMPGVKGVTNARPGSEEWEMAKEAVQNFGAEFHALMSEGTDIQAIDISGRGELPYPKLVERMDRAMTALWLGSDLSTLSHKNAVGSMSQRDERELLEEDDAAMLSGALNEQVNKHVIKLLLGSNTNVKAHISLSKFKSV